MPQRVEEDVDVHESASGEPLSFTWRGFEYEVIGLPQPFFRRRLWWRDSSETMPGQVADLTRIDQQLWRVEATDDGRTTRLYDLLRAPGHRWTLQVAWE